MRPVTIPPNLSLPPARVRLYVLEEYLFRLDRFDDFVAKNAAEFATAQSKYPERLRAPRPAGSGFASAWARNEVFAFVIYYKQGRAMRTGPRVGIWTRKLIDAALILMALTTCHISSTPHRINFAARIHARLTFYHLKRRLDPTNKFRKRIP